MYRPEGKLNLLKVVSLRTRYFKVVPSALLQLYIHCIKCFCYIIILNFYSAVISNVGNNLIRSVTAFVLLSESLGIHCI